ncbi:MAG: hypothetical protein RLZZ522_1010, partial [Verrucomicrobiota bacterium]
MEDGGLSDEVLLTRLSAIYSEAFVAEVASDYLSVTLFEIRNDGLVSTGGDNMATLGTLGAGAKTAYPIDPPGESGLMSWYYFGGSAPLM